MRITVVVTAFNASLTIGDAIDGVLKQGASDLELIVVDDGSTDGTGDLVRQIAPMAEVVTQENQGPSAARNAGIARATGDLVAFLDGDDVWHPSKLGRQLEVLEAHPELDLLATSWSRRYPEPEPDGELRWLGYLDQLALNQFQTSTVLARRSLLERVGGFDSALDGVEDWDFWTRCAAQGTLAVLESKLVMYRDSPEGVSKDMRRFLQGTTQFLAKERERGLLAPRHFSVIESWHYQRIAVASLLVHDPMGAVMALGRLERLPISATIEALRTRTIPFLSGRLQRRRRQSAASWPVLRSIGPKCR